MHLEDSISFILFQVIVRTVVFPFRRIGIHGQQESRRATEDLVIFHSQIGLLEINAQGEGFDVSAARRTFVAGAFLRRLEENRSQSHLVFVVVAVVGYFLLSC